MNNNNDRSRRETHDMAAVYAPPEYFLRRQAERERREEGGDEYPNNRRVITRSRYCLICHRWIPGDFVYCPYCGRRMTDRSQRFAPEPPERDEPPEDDSADPEPPVTDILYAPPEFLGLDDDEP